MAANILSHVEGVGIRKMAKPINPARAHMETGFESTLTPSPSTLTASHRIQYAIAGIFRTNSSLVSWRIMKSETSGREIRNPQRGMPSRTTR